jgi:hypothetical protein
MQTHEDKYPRCHYCKQTHEIMAEYFCTGCRQTFCDAQATRDPHEGITRHSPDEFSALPPLFHRVRLPLETRYCGPLDEMEI